MTIQSRPPNKQYLDNWDNVFNKSRGRKKLIYDLEVTTLDEVAGDYQGNMESMAGEDFFTVVPSAFERNAKDDERFANATKALVEGRPGDAYTMWGRGLGGVKT